MTVLSGRELAAHILARTAAQAAELAAARRPPRLTVVTAADDPATAWYARSIARATANAGIGCEVEDLGPAASAAAIGAQLAALSGDPKVAGIAGALSPVPGGVGPVTTALLLQHVTEAAAGSGVCSENYPSMLR